MRVLVVGSGAREHVLSWCAARSPLVETVVTAPGNTGTAALGENVPVDPLDLPALVALARRVAPDLTVVGADDPLAAGAIDALQAAGLRAFGPTRAAAEIESSKVWSKGFMRRHGIPTAPFEVFDDAGAAHRFLDGNPWEGRLVVKADGLTRGKGVIVPDSLPEAHAALTAVMEQRAYGPGGRRVVIERRLEGPEASVFALCDGETAIPFGTARDHKRIFDGDRGPNTGGMGAYSPTRLVPAPVLDEVMARVVRPAVAGLAAEGRPFKGFLYAGIMLTAAGPQVIEFNARFGDPEAQAVLPLLESDPIELLERAVDGRLAGGAPPRWRDGAACAVCLASAGYPEAVRDGVPLSGLEEVSQDAGSEGSGVHVFHAGTVRRDGALFTTGGRILTVTGLGADLAAARRAAYTNVERIRFEGMQYRRDIGAQEASA
jgi:phosphoribosylamine--glycine ligase